MANRGLKRGTRPLGFGVIACVLIIGQVGAVDLEACEVCHCHSVSLMVDCSNKGLTELPIGIPNDTARLDLRGNFLQEIPEKWLLQFHRLVSLAVSRNRISKPFAVPSSLLALFADHNQLPDIGLIMKTGYKLQQAYFDTNRVEAIRTDTFGKRTNLLEVELTRNNISKIEPGGLALSDYTKILLNFNQITELSPDMFGGRRLKTIHIMNTNLTRLKSSALGFFRSIGRFKKNNIHELPDGLFLDKADSERAVQIIELSYNNIRKVSPSAFKGLFQVQSLTLAANKLNDETLPNDLLVNLTINYWFDLSMNELTQFPGKLLRTQDKLRYLYIQQNHITALDDTMFKGLQSLESLFIYQNPIMQMADLQFYETSLKYIVMFQCNITEVGMRPFVTKGNTIQQVLMHGNPIEQIEDTIWQDLGPDCYVSIDNSLRKVPHMNRTDLDVELVGDDFVSPFYMSGTDNDFFTSSGLVCHTVAFFDRQCTPCQQGTYGLYFDCIPCPPGGFYQSKTGQYSQNELMNCQICKKGTYVSPEAHPGTRASDCNVCPTGTDKSTAAGFRACPCVDNYYRTDRFGECHQCPREGINCSGEYQHLLRGYWWTWSWTSQENHDSYLNFVTNIRIESDSYEKTTLRFGGKLPQVHKCPRDDTCPNGGIGIDTTCSAGYTGWLCSECEQKYYSWLGHCIECPEWPLFAVEVFGILLVVCIVVGFFVWDAYRRHRRNERNILSVFLARGKIVVGFCQVMGEIFSALDEIPWPGTLHKLGSFFKTLEVGIVGWLISPRCFILDFTYPNIYIEFLVSLSFIIAVVVLSFCYYGFRKCYLSTAKGLPAQHYREALGKSKRRCFLVVVILLFLSYPSVCSVIITLLPTGCNLFYMDEDKELNVTLLRYDYAIDCESPQHSIYNYAAETAMVYVVGFPVVLFLLLWSSKRRLGSKEDRASVSSQNSDRVLPDISQDRIGDTDDQVTQSEATISLVPTETSEPFTKIGWESFLCENYKAEFWYWEIVELSRKILQTLFLLLFGPEDHFTLFASVVLSVFFLLIHAYLKPMKDAAEQRLQMCSLVTIFLNMLAASLLLMPNDTGPVGENKKTILAITLVLLNLNVIGFVALSFIWTGIKALSRHGCFALMMKSVKEMYRCCRRRCRREQDGQAYLDDGDHSRIIVEQNEQTSGDQDATSDVSDTSVTATGVTLQVQ